MQVLTPREYQSFKTLVKMNQNELHRTLHRILKRTYGKDAVTFTEDYLIARGDIPIVLVAHMDTVFHDPPTEIFYDREENVIWSPQGLGADDRAGVFAILQIISSGYRPHVVFTTNEEWGGIGASALAEEPCPFDKVLYVIELDRAHKNDCVFYECDNIEFSNYIESFGFEYNIGSYSDICELCPAWERAGVNLSIGYRDEHQTVEVLFVSHMLSTIKKVKKMLDNPPEKPFKFEWQYGSYQCSCAKCHKPGTAFNMVPIYGHNHHKMWYCGDCITDENVEWCQECYEGFLPGILEDGICPDCKETKERFKRYGVTGQISWDQGIF